MADPGTIQGSKQVELFNQLIDRKTIISMNVVGTDYNRLTCIMGVQEETEGNFLIIDLAKGFKEAAEKTESLHLRFNFNGPDRLEYLFSTKGGHYNGKELRVPFPNKVERIQRRRDFRVDTFPGTRMLFKIGKKPVIISMINISLGGGYGALTKCAVKETKGSLLKKDKRIYNIGIIFPGDKEMDEQVVIIKKAIVRRVENHKEKRLYKYAFEFAEIEKEAKAKLTQSIYHIQRKLLQKK